MIPAWYLGFPLIGKIGEYGYCSTVFLRLNLPEYQIYSGIVIPSTDISKMVLSFDTLAYLHQPHMADNALEQ